MIASMCAACGGGGDGPGGGGDPAEIDACQLVTQEDAAALFGQPATRDEAAEPFAIGDGGFVEVDDFAGVDMGWRQDDLAVYLSLFTIGPMVPTATSKVDEVKAIALEASARL